MALELEKCPMLPGDDEVNTRSNFDLPRYIGSEVDPILLVRALSRCKPDARVSQRVIGYLSGITIPAHASAPNN